MNNIEVPAHWVYCLRTVNADMTAHGGFLWPASGYVEAPDWDPSPTCGHGLHGLLRGEGDGGLLCWGDDARWQVVAVDPDDIVDLGGKAKYPRGIVVYTGDRMTATRIVSERHPGAAVVGGTAMAGDYGTATAGYRGTATAGDYGTATAGDYGTATAGYRGTAAAGYRGTATAGDYGIIQIKYWDGTRTRLATGYIGEGGLRPHVAYRWDFDSRRFTCATLEAGGET